MPSNRPELAKKSKKVTSLRNYWRWGLLVGLLILPFYYGLIIKSVRSGYRWIADKIWIENYPHYDSYAIRIPKGFEVHGIDVSRYQGKIDWKRVKEMEDGGVKIDFVFIKATEGLTNVDPYFERNWRETRKHKFIRGAYHYFKPKRSGVWQARFFLQTVDLVKGDLLPVVDVEETGNIAREDLQINLRDFLRQIEKKTGVKPIIYTGYRFYQDNLAEKFKDYPLWIAHYHQPALNFPPDTRWRFWQHADHARIDGIGHVVDMNVFNGDNDALEEVLIR